MAPSAGLEPATPGLEVPCSIQLSYEGFLKFNNNYKIFCDFFFRRKFILFKLLFSEAVSRPSRSMECKAYRIIFGRGKIQRMANERLARFFLHGYVFLPLRKVVSIIEVFNPTLILLIDDILLGMFILRFEY